MSTAEGLVLGKLWYAGVAITHVAILCHRGPPFSAAHGAVGSLVSPFPLQEQIYSPLGQTNFDCQWSTRLKLLSVICYLRKAS